MSASVAPVALILPVSLTSSHVIGGFVAVVSVLTIAMRLAVGV